MNHNASFWIGFFSAALIIMPIGVGVWGLSGDMAESLVVFLFGLIAALVLILVLAVMFKDKILTKILGKTEASLEDAVASIVRIASAATIGDRNTIEKEAVDVGKTLSGWYVWSNFYRWVIGSAIGLLVAFGAFVGTVLLFEQNRKLGEQTIMLQKQTTALNTQTDRLTDQTGFMSAQTKLMEAQTERLAEQTQQASMQNEIMTLSLVNQLRDQILASVEEVSFYDYFVEVAGPKDSAFFLKAKEAEKSCVITFAKTPILQLEPSAATITEITRLASEGALSERIKTALKVLLTDNSGAVVFAAAQSLYDIGEPFDTAVTIRRMLFEELHFPDAAKLEFVQSVIMESNCENCEISADQSIISDPDDSDAKISGWGSLLAYGRETKSDFSGLPRSTVLLGPSDSAPENYTSFQVAFPSGDIDWASKINPFNQSPCEVLQELAEDNPFIEYEAFVESEDNP